MIKKEKTYSLNEKNIDQIAADVMEICDSLKMRRDQSLKLRLLIEDALMIWMQQLENGAVIELKADKLFFKPYLDISCRSERSCNPLAVEDSGFFTELIMKNLTVSPDYVYRKGKNTLHCNLPKPKRSPMINLLLVIMTALLIGFLGTKFIPADIITTIQETFISPTYNKFLDILRCIAGPLIFCSVAWGIYGIGDASTLSKLGKGLILRYIRDVFIVAVCCIVFFPFFGCVLSEGSVDFSNLMSVYTMFLDMIPVSIVDPFATGNTLQIIVLAVCVGIALIFLGKRTQYVAVAIEQFNLITTFLMTAISKLVPLFIAFVLINMIWTNSFSVMSQTWKFILGLLVGLVVLILFITARTSLRFQVRFKILVKKIMPSFLIALVTASSSAAFGTIVDNCQNQFGIQKSLTGFGIPLGIVIYKMASAINNMLLVFYFAGINHIECSISWIIMAVIVSTIAAIASPPVPGGAVIAYSMIFTQLGLPEESLAVALAIDMLSDFLITSTNIYCLPFGLISVAAQYDLLNLETLRKE